MLLVQHHDDKEIMETKRHLEGFPYERSTVVIHRDPNLMPTLKKDWAVCLTVIFQFGLLLSLLTVFDHL